MERGASWVSKGIAWVVATLSASAMSCSDRTFGGDAPEPVATASTSGAEPSPEQPTPPERASTTRGSALPPSDDGAIAPGSSTSAAEPEALAQRLPGQTEREAELLAALAIDDATLHRASGTELIDLVQAIGLARGYLLCRCHWFPEGAPPDEDFERLLEGCVPDESIRIVADAAKARCVAEQLPVLPGLEDYLRCLGSGTRDGALGAPQSCLDGEHGPAPEAGSCELPPGGEETILGCALAHECPDGSLVEGPDESACSR